MAYPGPIFPDNRKRGQDYPYTKKTAVQFGGYNHRKSAGDMEWWDDQNMTAAYSPLLASRKPMWYAFGLDADYHGICGGDELFIAAGTGIYNMQDGITPGGVDPIATVTNDDKLMCVFGTRLMVWPDKKSIIVHSDDSEATVENLEVHQNPSSITFYSGTYQGEEATANCIYLDSVPHDLFHVNDAVTISGCVVHPENNMTIIIREVEQYDVDVLGETVHCTILHFYDNSFVIGDGTTNIIDKNGTTQTVDGYMEEASSTVRLAIDRNVPNLDILFVHENRLWGAKGDTIYASALGDPFNWNVFDGLGTDSWTVDVLDEGDFTGGCSFLGYPVFFKDNHIYKVYGNVPSDFQLVQSADLGVEEGSGKSLAIAGEKLYYLSRAGVMVYSGSLPQVISQPLGDIHYKNAIAGSDGIRYWVSLQQDDGSRDMFEYDTQTGIWHRQMCIDNGTGSGTVNCTFTDFAWHNHGMFAVSDESSRQTGRYATQVYYIGDEENQPRAASVQAENPIQWYVESADFTEYSPQRKWIGPRIEIRAELGIGASFTVKVKHNNVDNWLTIGGPFTNTGQTGIKKSFVCSKIPARADFYKIRIEGTGRVWIYSIAPMTEQGSSDFGYNGG